MELVPEEKRQVIQKDLDLLPQEPRMESGETERAGEEEEILAEEGEENAFPQEKTDRRKKKATREEAWL